MVVWAVWTALKVLESAMLEVYPNFQKDAAKWIIQKMGS
jgi:hypothetical protein